MSKVFDIAALDWQAVRPDIARGVLGKTLLDEKTKVMIVRVLPGGKSDLHRDSYSHVFYFLSGEGTVQVGDLQVAAKPGTVAQVTAGELHGYENTGHADLTMLSLNLPV